MGANITKIGVTNDKITPRGSLPFSFNMSVTFCKEDAKRHQKYDSEVCILFLEGEAKRNQFSVGAKVAGITVWIKRFVPFWQAMQIF